MPVFRGAFFWGPSFEGPSFWGAQVWGTQFWGPSYGGLALYIFVYVYIYIFIYLFVYIYTYRAMISGEFTISWYLTPDSRLHQTSREIHIHNIMQSSLFTLLHSLYISIHIHDKLYSTILYHTLLYSLSDCIMFLINISAKFLLPDTCLVNYTLPYSTPLWIRLLQNSIYTTWCNHACL